MVSVQSILSAVPPAMLLVNQRGIIESCSRGSREVFGFEPSDALGKNLATLVSAKSPEATEAIASFLREDSGKEAMTCDCQVERNEDGASHINLSIYSTMSSESELFIVVARDLTEENKRHCELAQSQKLESIGQLAAGIAHEINTPIQYVGDNTRFLEESFRDIVRVLEVYGQLLKASEEGGCTHDIRSQVETVIEEVDLGYLMGEAPRSIGQSLQGISHVAKIVRAMKDFSHPGVTEKTQIDLNQAIESTITIARNEWKYVATVQTDLDENLPHVWCLAGDINQVILNLLVNAAHAIGDVVEGTSELGTITISTRKGRSDDVEIRVSDTGCGMPEEVKSRIFDPFFTTKEVGRGTGQGLAIVRSVVVEKHSGTIHCETESGKGTTFILRLPLDGRTNRKNTNESDKKPASVCR